jgi:hypothetical protein
LSFFILFLLASRVRDLALEETSIVSQNSLGKGTLAYARGPNQDQRLVFQRSWVERVIVLFGEYIHIILCKEG